MHVSWSKKFEIIFFYTTCIYFFISSSRFQCTFISMHLFLYDKLTQAATNFTCVTRYASIKVNKFLHVAISVASLWILVHVTIRFRGILHLDRRDADRRYPSENQGGGSSRTASSHREIPLARRKPRRFLLHFRHLFHREPVVPNHFFSSDPVPFRQDGTLIAVDWIKTGNLVRSVFKGAYYRVDEMIRENRAWNNGWENAMMSMPRPSMR